MVLAQKVLDNARSGARCRKEQQSAAEDFHFVYSWRVVIRGDDSVLGYYFGSSSSSAQKTEVLKSHNAKRIE